MALLCHCSSLSFCVATHHILCQIQDWDTLSGRRGGEEERRRGNEEEGEEERMRGERRGGGIKCEDEEEKL